MHFEDINTKLSKRMTYQQLSQHLSNKYKKGKKGYIREILSNGDIDKAIDNAKRLEQKYENTGMTIFNSIGKMNPYTNMYKLVEQLMLIIS